MEHPSWRLLSSAGQSSIPYRRLIEQGWTDALRALHPDDRIYTFWKYVRNAFGRNAGLRIDHLLLSPSLAGRLVAANVDREVRGSAGASDHAVPQRCGYALFTLLAPGEMPHLRPPSARETR